MEQRKEQQQQQQHERQEDPDEAQTNFGNDQGASQGQRHGIMYQLPAQDHFHFHPSYQEKSRMAAPLVHEPVADSSV
jgi:hypothetical protein